MHAAFARHRVVHRRQEPVSGPDVRPHLNVQLARKRQTPVALARADTARQSLLRVAVLEVLGVEVGRLAAVDGQRDRAVGLPLVVDRVDAYLARLGGVVDDPHEPLAVQCISRRREKWNRLRFLLGLRGRRHDAEPDNRCRERAPCLPPAEIIHLRIAFRPTFEIEVRVSRPCGVPGSDGQSDWPCSSRNYCRSDGWSVSGRLSTTRSSVDRRMR